MSITDNTTNPDFNYRSLGRKDLMSLSTITKNDTITKKFKQVDTNRDWSTNLYNLDIEGSVPKKFGVLHQKTDFINKVDDIERTNSKILHFPLNKPEYNLETRDIFWASPQANREFITTRKTNPLEPKYNLAKVEEMTHPVPKFIRDNINVDGIEGAHPKKYFQWQTRQMFDNSEVKGSSPKKSYVRGTNYQNIDYSDVTHNAFKTRRCVDPLDPVYEVKYKGGEDYIHGHIEGSKPVTYPPYIYPEPYNLKTNDIDGTQTGSKNRINKFSGQGCSLITNDVRGALSGSLKKGIVTDRMTNPLTPNYNYLGQKELKGRDYNPYGESLFSKSAKGIRGNRQQSQEGNGNFVIMNESGDVVGIQPSNKNGIEKQNSNVSKKNVQENNNKNNHSQNENFKSGPQNLNSESRKMNPYEIIGFNNQVYIEEPVDFDASKFKKPDPYYGFVHDKYLISNEGTSSNLKPNFIKRESNGSVGSLGKKANVGSLNGNTMGSVNNMQNIMNTNNMQNSMKESKNNNSGSNFGKSTGYTDFNKQSYAQLMDKFISRNPGFD